MDLETTISTITDIAEHIPGELEGILENVSVYIPSDLSSVIKHASSYFPAELDFASAAMFMLYFAAASLILGVISRVVLGKRSSLNHSLSSAMGILFVYAVTIVFYTFQPWNLQVFLSPLPFVTFSGEYMVIHPITDMQFPALCTQLLALLLLAFLVNLLDTIIPKGKSALGWYLLRFISVVLSIVLFLAARWAIHTYLPETLVTYAPMILLILLVFMLLSGVLNLILGFVIAMANPFLGAMYTFFFSNVVGKQLSKAFFTSGILCVIFYLMDFFGLTVITITSAALMAYIPLALVFLLLWYLIGHLL